MVSAAYMLGVDYEDLTQVVELAKKFPGSVVVKYHDRPNYNVTMQREKSVLAGALVMWSPRADHCPTCGSTHPRTEHDYCPDCGTV